MILLHADLAMSGVGIWKTYTSKKEVRDVVILNGKAWSASSGGMFSVTPADSIYEEFTASEGLRSNDLSTITADQSGSVWIGSSNGWLQSYDTRNRSWKYISDIVRDASPQKQINALTLLGDTLFVSSDIGLSIYLISRGEFRATARSFGASSPITGNATAALVYHDTILVSTRSGIAAAPKSSANLSAPDSWQLLSIGLPSLNVSSLAIFQDTLYAATANGIAKFNGSSWGNLPGMAGMNVLKMITTADSLYFITGSQIIVVDTQGMVSTVAGSFPSSLSCLANSAGTLIIGSSSNGLYWRNESVWQNLLPPGPISNRINGIALDYNGKLWAGTGADGGEGFMSFNGGTWESYRTQLYPMLPTNDYYKVNVGPGNLKWASSWGRGVALIGANDSLLAVYNKTNGLPPTLTNDTTYVVVFGVVADRDGQAWIGVRTGRADTTFAIFGSNGQLTYKKFSYPGVVGAPTFIDFTIDSYGTKWFVNAKASEVDPVGLYFYNERGFPGTDTSKWGRITSSAGLSSDKIFSLAVDLSGQVWIGTDAGLTIITNPYNLRPAVAPYYPLREQQINAIAVDPLNNKWVATSKGITLLSPDGTSIIAQYTVENTDAKLVDNNISSIVIDAKSGTVYFGSDKGLSSLTTASVTAVRSYDGLLISPNPFYLPSSEHVTIDGLVQNSTLKILSIDGALINEIKTPGGRIGFWDGTDSKGQNVASGIYVVVAYSENGSQVAAGKIAVLRK